MRVLIVGAGAVGGYFGARLVAAERDVTFLVRPGRAEQLARRGLVVRELDKPELTVHPPTVTAAELTPSWDLIVVAVKAFGLAAALDSIAPAIGEHTAVLPLLNGMAHLDTIGARFGTDRVLGGIAFCAAYLQDDGAIVVGSIPPALTYGELDGHLTDRIRRVDETLRDAGFQTTLSTTIEADLWDKWVFLASGGVLAALSRGTVGDAVAAAGGERTALDILDEAAAVSTASGYPPRDTAIRRAQTLLTEPGSSFVTSMGKDLFAGRPTEDEHIVGDLVRRADRLGVPVPLIRSAQMALQVATTRRVGQDS